MRSRNSILPQVRWPAPFDTLRRSTVDEFELFARDFLNNLLGPDGPHGVYIGPGSFPKANVNLMPNGDCIIEADFCGVPKEDIRVRIKDKDLLIISSACKRSLAVPGNQKVMWSRRELSEARCDKAIKFEGRRLKKEDIEVEYRHGLLKVTVKDAVPKEKEPEQEFTEIPIS